MPLVPTAADRFGGTLTVQRTAYYLVQAVDWAGNIGTVSISGDDVDAEGNPIGSTFNVPQLFTIFLDGGGLFADGFESAGTDAWSVTSP